MSHAGVFRPLAAVLVVASLVSCTPTADVQADFLAALPSVDEIQIKFLCDANNSIALSTTGNQPAWAVRRKQTDPITWTVPGNVKINSITGLPLDADGPQGGSNGTSYKSKINEHAGKKLYD